MHIVVRLEVTEQEAAVGSTGRETDILREPGRVEVEHRFVIANPRDRTPEQLQLLFMFEAGQAAREVWQRYVAAAKEHAHGR